MLNAFRRSCVPSLSPATFLALLLSISSGIFAGSAAHAQATTTAKSPLWRQLDRVDLGVSGAYMLTKSDSGTNYLNSPINLTVSSTVGALVQIGYTRSPLVGFQFNYGYARFTENYNFTAPASTLPVGLFPVQTKATEYTFGYVAHLPTMFHVQPFAAVGAGTTAFTPTPNGGEGLSGSEQARMTYYYGLGVQQDINKNFGFRVGFRQLFYKAPDFGQNYLTIQKQTFTSEPTFGFYLKF